MAHIVMIGPKGAVQEKYSQAISSVGHQVTIEDDPKNLDAYLSGSPPDLFIVEIRIPGASGLTVIASIKAEAKETPIIALSETMSQNLEREIYAQGAIEILEHDLKQEEILYRLNKICASDVAMQPQKTTHKSGRLLVVDDEENICDALEEFFTGKGFEVTTVNNGVEALAAIEKQVPDAVLLDIRMPEMDGIETLKRIKERHPDLGVIMATAVNDKETVEKTRQLGSYHYVNKPFDFDYLEMVVLTRIIIAS